MKHKVNPTTQTHEVGDLIVTTVKLGSSYYADTRTGRLLFHNEEKIICFGLGVEDRGMFAKTITDKGTFLNGYLDIVYGIEQKTTK